VTLLVGREHASLAGVPKHWRGPIPNPFVTRMLKPKGSFYKKIPMSLLASGAPDLGVMVWALLRLSFDGQANVGSYRRFAQCLNLDHLTDTAIDKRFGPALRPLLGKWITRKRLPDNSYLYEAKVPAAAASDRYAILRPSDVDLLAVTPPKGLTSIEVGDLVDFCRWQLECGRRGWTIEPLRRIADRWKVTHPAIARSRDRLAKLGLLKVVPRTGGRFSDLIWLEELYDPHWQVPSIIHENTDQGQAGDNDGGGTYRGELWNGGLTPVLGHAESRTRDGQGVSEMIRESWPGKTTPRSSVVRPSTCTSPHRGPRSAALLRTWASCGARCATGSRRTGPARRPPPTGR
jgi:hypothetical protein